MKSRRLKWSALVLCLLLIGLLLTLFRFQKEESQNHRNSHHKKVTTGTHVGTVEDNSGQQCAKGLVKNRNQVCVKPNPSSTIHWVYPSGKPSLPRVTTPPEKSPPAVETTRVGGGGVIDNPTNSPSSESGVTAPSASPAPTTPRPTPSNEGGSNNGVVGGF